MHIQAISYLTLQDLKMWKEKYKRQARHLIPAHKHSHLQHIHEDVNKDFRQMLTKADVNANIHTTQITNLQLVCTWSSKAQNFGDKNLQQPEKDNRINKHKKNKKKKPTNGVNYVRREEKTIYIPTRKL